MANLNLSEFTEKLFVADADHTFIWDTAASISKRVSRNSWLNSGTLTSDAPVTISQTWGTTGTYTAFKVMANETAASATASNLLELWSGSTVALKFNVRKDGAAFSPFFTYSAAMRIGPNAGNSNVHIFGSGNGGARLSYKEDFANEKNIFVGASNINIDSKGTPINLVGDTVLTGTLSFTPNTILLRDGTDNTLALRNGAAAQTFNVYGTYTSGSVYERMFMRYNGTDLAFQVGAETLGATARPLQLWTGGASRLHITTAGNVGIGTTAPQTRLDVHDDVRVGGFLYLDRPGNALANNYCYFKNRPAGIPTTFGNPLGLGAVEFVVVGTSGFIMGTTANVPLAFATNSAERVRILGDGNVGIGTASPTSKLQVSAGDIEVDTIAKGVILKSPDGTRYRITVPNGGASLTITAV